MGISRDSWHKKRSTGGQKVQPHKKRKYELGRHAAGTKIGGRRVHEVRTRGGNRKFRALRLDTGNFAWATEGQARKSRIIDVVYNASNNELVRTKTLVKNCIVLIDATPYRQWYEGHYALPLARRTGVKLSTEDEANLNKKRTGKALKRLTEIQSKSNVEQALVDQFRTGRILAAISSRPGQSGKADGYILEGKELEFYLKKIKSKKSK